jgi:DnaK suppressor protein
MTKIIATIRNKLQRRLDQLKDRMDNAAGDMAVCSGDIADAAFAADAMAISGAIIGSEIAEYNHIIAAITKIDDGTYGICTDCANKIRPERLEAMPYTLRCINCQEVADKS